MKVRVTNTTFSTPKGESINGKIFDAEKEGKLYTISARDLHKINPDAFDPNYGKYHFCPNEIEVLSESAHEKFKTGDKVRFKKEFYKEECFKGLTREKRKVAANVASLGEFEVSCVYESSRRVRVIDKFYNCYDINASLLELCKVEKKPAKVKVGDKIRITRYQGGDVVGTVATVIYVAGTEIAYKSEKSKSGKYWTTSDSCELVTDPEVKEVKRIAKVGDFIKITSFNLGGEIGTVAEVVDVSESGCVTYKSVNSPDGTFVSSFYEIVEPPKRKWTEEEIVKAKCFLAEELIYHPCRFNNKSDGTIRCLDLTTCKQAFSKCSPKDEYNRYIGAVVAYCKTSGVKIPEFIQH